MSNTYGIPEEDEKEVRARDKHLLRVFSVADHPDYRTCWYRTHFTGNYLDC
jgi:hypothetical protein